MKCYFETNGIKIVGKGWEVRYLIKRWVQESGPGTTVAELANKRNNVKHATRPLQLHKSTRKIADQLPNLFPSS